MATATEKNPKKIDVDMSDLIITKDHKRFIKAKRYSLFHSTQHWGNTLLMVLFFLTGLEIAFGKHLVGDYLFTQNFHLVIGYIIMFWSIGYYAFVVYWDKKLYEVIPTPRDILDSADPQALADYYGRRLIAAAIVILGVSIGSL